MPQAKKKIAVIFSVILVLCIAVAFVFYKSTPFTWEKELSSNDDSQYVKWTGVAPEQVARDIFDACSRADADQLAKFLRTPDPIQKIIKTTQGLQILSLGKPFRAGLKVAGGKQYAGVLVPYEVRLGNGKVEKGNLAIRCDNSEKRWYVDGGL